MLIYSMGVSVAGFFSDREGEFGWTGPSDALAVWLLADG
jgi:hypothetical protein